MPTSSPSENQPNEYQKFDAVMKKIISVPREELKRREKEWKRKRARKKRAKE